jgi:RNA-binding protein YhbY
LKLEDILNSDYLETDTPKSLIEENQNIKNIVHYILRQLEEKEVLKVKFNKKDFIKEMEEDYDLKDKVREVSEDLLQCIVRNHGKLEVIEKNNITSLDDINSLWKFSGEEVNNLDKENRQYYCRF